MAAGKGWPKEAECRGPEELRGRGNGLHAIVAAAVYNCMHCEGSPKTAAELHLLGYRISAVSKSFTRQMGRKEFLQVTEKEH